MRDIVTSILRIVGKTLVVLVTIWLFMEITTQWKMYTVQRNQEKQTQETSQGQVSPKPIISPNEAVSKTTVPIRDLSATIKELGFQNERDIPFASEKARAGSCLFSLLMYYPAHRYDIKIYPTVKLADIIDGDWAGQTYMNMKFDIINKDEVSDPKTLVIECRFKKEQFVTFAVWQIPEVDQTQPKATELYDPTPYY